MDKSRLKAISAKLDKIADSYNIGIGKLVSIGFDKFDLELDSKFKEIALRSDLDESQKFELCAQRVAEMLQEENEENYSLKGIEERYPNVDNNQIQEAIEQIIEDSKIE